MDDKKVGKIHAAYQDNQAGNWPPWSRYLVTAVILFHLGALLAGSFAKEPASFLEKGMAGAYAWYFQAIDQGYSYRFYAPEPGPTPVVTATIRHPDGREESVRLPDRKVKPRLRYQRQLALANHLVAAHREAGAHGEASLYARSYARHLARTHPGCTTVTLFTQDHLIPMPGQVLAKVEAGVPVDLDDEEFYTVPERIGEFPCDAF